MPPVQSRQDEQDFDNYFSLVSGFYGPGALICWYLILASVFLDNLLCLLRSRHPRLSNDLIAAVLYPIITSIHLLHQICAFPQGFNGYLLDNLTNSLFDYPTPSSAVSVDHSTVTSRYEVDTSNLDHRGVYPKIAAMVPAIRIVDTFGCFWLMYTCVAFFHDTRNRGQIMQNIALNIALALTCISRAAFIIRFWNADDNDDGYGGLSASGFLFLSAFLQGLYPFIGMMMPLVFIFILYSLSPVLWGAYPRSQFNIKRNSHDFTSMCQYVGSYLGVCLLITANFGLLLGSFMFLIWKFDYAILGPLFLPPSGIRVTELDQTATLIGGVFVLFFAIYKAWKQR